MASVRATDDTRNQNLLTVIIRGIKNPAEHP